MTGVAARPVSERRRELRRELERVAGPDVFAALSNRGVHDMIAITFAATADEVIVNHLMRFVLTFAFPNGQPQENQFDAVPGNVQNAAMAALAEAHARIVAAYHLNEVDRGLRLRDMQQVALAFLNHKMPVKGQLATGGLLALLGAGGIGAVPLFIAIGPGASLTGAAVTTGTLAWFGGGSLAAGGGGMLLGVGVVVGLGAVGAAAVVGGTILGIRALKRPANLSVALERVGFGL